MGNKDRIRISPQRQSAPEPLPLVELNAAQVQALADRLYSVSVSVLATIGPQERADMRDASRALRRLLAAIERETGRPLHTIMIAGG